MSSCCSSGLHTLTGSTPFSRFRPATLLGLLLLAGCGDSAIPPESAENICQANFTEIATLQGDDDRSPFAGSAATTSGVVTYVVAGEGFYIEDPAPVGNRGSSRALFVSDQELSFSIRRGQQLSVTGLVAELGSPPDTLTSLAELSGFETCAEDLDLPLTRAALPLDPSEREALEGMRLAFEPGLTVTDVYNLYRGELTLSSGGMLRVPTETRIPGPAAVTLEQENREHSLAAILPESADDALSVGSTAGAAIGLMGHDGRKQQLLLESLQFTDSPPPEPPEPSADGSIRIVSSNLLNFFNGDGMGSGFPTERGAESLQEFEAQSARIRAAMIRIQPDLLAVQELENDGFGPHSAARSLLDLLNKTGHDDWTWVEPATERIGADVITVGLFYRQNVLHAVGPAQVLDGPEFTGLSRQPLAQLFRDRRSGKSLLVAVNHLKSKGRCPDNGVNTDQEDGQGCWNAARLAAVIAETSWLAQLAEESGTDNTLVLGDMNAWRKEDPIRQFRDSGYVELVERIAGLPQYSFLYWGQLGTLDYALATPALAEYARGAEIWHINSTQPQNMAQVQPWLRASDHDPVVVDFDFSQPEASD